MKMHAHILFVLVLGSICLSSLSGCKTKKNMQKTETYEYAAHRIESSLDKSLATKEAGSAVSIQTNQNIREFNRTTLYDSTGNVQSVSETWRETGRAELALRNDSTRTVSVNNIATTDSISETANATSDQVIKNITDSRPVQGTEWLWVIFAIGTLAAVAILLFIKKLK